MFITDSPLDIKSSEQIASETLAIIEEERSGEQTGLYCRFDSMNKAVSKWFRFGYITGIAGLSGSGKSYLGNILIDDFTNPELNSGFRHKVLCVVFSFETKASDEMLRTASRQMNKSYTYLRSSEFSNGSYNTLNQVEFEATKQIVEKLAKRNILYVETSGNKKEIEHTLYYIAKKNPNTKIVVLFDHALLIKKLDEASENEVMTELMQTIIRVTKDLNLMTFILNQLNQNLETPLRRENPLLHRPLKLDIHGSNQFYWGCDNVLIWHKPELINLSRYTEKQIPTKNLIHGVFLKSRFGKAGNLWFKDRLEISTFEELSNEEKRKLNILSATVKT